MTELYLVFIGIAAVLFVGIVVYSAWTQRRTADRRANSVLKNRSMKYSRRPDPLFEPSRAESATRELSDEPRDRVDSVKVKTKISPTLSESTSSSSSLSVQAQTGLGENGARSDNELTHSEPSVEPAVKKDNTVEFTQAKKVNKGASKRPVVDKLPALDANQAIIIELVARLKNLEPKEQNEILKLFRNHDYKFNRSVRIWGLNELTDLWRDVEYELSAARFVELGLAIQLADRDGAMNTKELHDFQQMALDFSNSFDAPFEFSMEIDDAIEQGKILDQIGRCYDSMAVLNVVPRSKAGFRMADIESCARDLRMPTDKNGIFVKTSGHRQAQKVLYRLACTDGSGHFGKRDGAVTPIHDLVIYMNVPATENPDRVFQDMVKDATSLATWLDGKVVDRNGKVMTQRLYSVLLQQISDIAYSMQQVGIVAGDEISKKLF